MNIISISCVTLKVILKMTKIKIGMSWTQKSDRTHFIEDINVSYYSWDVFARLLEEMKVVSG